MNCLVVCQSRLWVVTIVFYTCILIPLSQLKRALLESVAMIYFLNYESKDVAKEMRFPETPSLPTTRYEDLRMCVGEGDERSREECCSICLVEYEGEDAVCKVDRCGHVFHLNCIQKWIHRNQFSCPLCRSSLFPQHHFLADN